MKKRKPKKQTLSEENQLLRARVRDFERLSEVLKTVCSTLRVEEILQHIIEEAVALCQSHQGSIILFDPQRGQSARTLIREGRSGESRLDHHLNTLLGGWVLEHQEPLLTDDLVQTFGRDVIKKKHRDIASALSMPLVVQGKIIGVVNLITLQKQKPLGQREAWLMEVLASQCVHFIVNAKLHEALFAETQRLRKELQDKYAFHGLIGHSPKMAEVFALLERILPTEGRVIIEGESGTGKELVARILHYNGPRKEGPFVAVDCGALPANLLESELFGYTKGAFTGATQDKKGLFEEADGGSLFLDEISNMPLEIQTKFLRAVQEGEIRPIGSTKVKTVDVRIIAAASGDLRSAVEAGKFREDLFYRLNVVNLKLPSLRERKEDIPILAHHFLKAISKRYGKNIKGFEAETLAILESYAWPGNVRELENAIERMVILAEPDLVTLSADLLPSEIKKKEANISESTAPESHARSIKVKKASYEKQMLLEALEKHHWNQSAAARELGIHESTLRYKMQRFGIEGRRG